jgi:hypothetical protein
MISSSCRKIRMNELDILIGRNVFGWEGVGCLSILGELPPFSTDLNVFWKLVAPALAKRGIRLELFPTTLPDGEPGYRARVSRVQRDKEGLEFWVDTDIEEEGSLDQTCFLVCRAGLRGLGINDLPALPPHSKARIR